MKKILISVILLITIQLQAQQLFSTNGNQILDPCGQAFIPRGVNYSLADDWNFPDNLNDGRERSSEIIKANPNTVRIEWYVDYGNVSRPTLTLEGLDSVISRFARANIVSILEIHDFTHNHTDTTAFNSQVIAWWTSPAVLQLINKHQSHLLLNIANEYGPSLYDSFGNPNANYTTQITAWVQHIKSCIMYLRSAGIIIPIIVDAPNYGMDYQTVIDHGSEFVSHDPLHKIIMSCHAYWNDNAAGMQSIASQMAALSFPVIFGEVGNVDFACAPIEVDAFLTAAKNNNLGWLAWTWNRDECPTRNMTANDSGNPSSPTDGKFSTLTTYGQQIVNNATYGLVTNAVKPTPGCLLGLAELSNNSLLKVYPNPASTELFIELDPKDIGATIHVMDVSGKEITSIITTSNTTRLTTVDWNSGIYFIQIRTGNKAEQVKCVVLK